MSSRRISSYNDIKPIQAITVDAFSKFNSENINRLTRIVSGSGNNDTVVNGLDVYGIDEPFSIKSSNLLNGCNWETEDCSYLNNQFEFTRKINVDKYYEWAETTLDPNSIPHDGRYSGYFELQFQLLNGTPSYLVFNLNKHVLDLKQLDMFNYKENGTEKTESGIHRLIFKYDFNFDNTFVFRIGIYQNNKDSNSINNGSNIILKNVRLYQIFDNSKLDYYLSQESIVEYDKYGTSNVHPIHKLGVSCGVAIKDDVSLDLLKSNFNDSKKIVELDTLNPSSWILNNPYTINDFSKRFCKPQVPVFGNGLNTDEKFYFDGEEGRLKYQITNGNEIYVTDDFKSSNDDYFVSITSTTKNNNVVKISYNKNQITENVKWLVLYSNNKPIFCIHKPFYQNNNYIEFYNDDTIDLESLSLKCLGDTLKVNGSLYSKELVRWGYVVIYSEYFKNPVPNKNYVGLIRDEDLEKPEYREDYLILAKVRFVDPATIDIITYSNSRQDLGVITAEDVNYFVTCKTGEIWNDDIPNTVTDALDILRLKEIDNYLKEKYKHDYDAEISDAFNLIKSDNDRNTDVKTKISIDNYSQLLRQTTGDATKIKVTKIETDSDNNPYFNTITLNSVFTLNSESTHFVFTDSNNEKWAVSKDFKEFGKFENDGRDNYTIHRKYISFNEFGPSKFIDPDTTLPVIEFDWVYNDDSELRIPSSVNTSVSSDNVISSDKTDIKDDYALSYHPDESSSAASNNNSQNHNQFISFRNNLLTTSRIKDELDFLPNNPDTLLNKRVLYGVKDSDNKVRIYSSRHQLADDMIDYHIINSVNNDSELITNPNNDGILDKSTKFIFDGDRPNNTFRTKTFLTSKTEGSSKVIIDTNYYYRNLINKRITISTDQDENDVYHVQSGSYDMDDLLYQYWFKPDAQIIDNKLHLRIDTEKNFIVRFSDIFIFLYKWCGSTGTRLSTFLNNNPSLSNKKMIDVVIDIDCTISKLRDLDRRLDGEYQAIDKYFKSKLLIINDCNETVKDDEYFNTYINTNFTFFYYPDIDGKYTPFRTAYNKHNNYVTILGYDLNSIDGRIYISNEQFIWKDDRRGWNNSKNDISSSLNVYPVTSKAKTNQTVADYVIDDNNAFDKARGCIRHTYAGCRSEFNFEYIKRYEPQDPNKTLPQYGIENSIDQSIDSDIEVETSEEKFIHTLDKLFATAEYYTIANKKVNTWKGENTNWIFTTDEGVISVLNQDEIVGDSLDELEEKIIESNISDKYSPEDDQDLEEFNEYSKGLAHIRIHKLQNVNNKNNGCLNLSRIDDNVENYRWIFSWEGDTGIWRSSDEKCLGRLSLLSTSNESNSTSFDVKQMVSWRNGVPEDECVIVLSSQNKNNLSTVEVIPNESIIGKNQDGENYKYLSNSPSNLKIEALCRTSIVGDIATQGSEFRDHMLVNNICVAESSEYGDMMFYIGKQRKDTYRFPPEDTDGKCTDVEHHASLIRTSWNPKITQTKGKTTKTIKNACKFLEEGLDISTDYISNEIEIKPSNTVGVLEFDKHQPSTSTINTIYTLHLGDSNNRFLSIGCANNFNTGIDWELSSYYSVGNVVPEQDYSNISNVKKYGDTVIWRIPSAYGIPKSIYEYDGRVYIATTNGILILNSCTTKPTDSTGRKFISFIDTIIKHTKWKVPYNYRYKHNENNGANILSFMTSTPNNSYAAIDELNISDMIKIRDGLYGVCGTSFVGYYNKDSMTTIIPDDNIKLINRDISWSQTHDIPVPAIIDYDKYGNNLIVCGLTTIDSNGNISNSQKKLVYNFNSKTKFVSNTSLRQVITVHDGKYVAMTDDSVILYEGSWNGDKFVMTSKDIKNHSNMMRIAYYNNKIYGFRDGSVFTYDINLEELKLENYIVLVSSDFNCKSASKIVYDFDSMYLLRRISDKKVVLTKITKNTIVDSVDSFTFSGDQLKRISSIIYSATYNKTYVESVSQNKLRYSEKSSLFLSKFKARSIVYGIEKVNKPHYYDPFSTSNNIKNNIQICGDKLDKIYPTSTYTSTVDGDANRYCGQFMFRWYVAVGTTPFPYYQLLYDRNLDSMLFAVNANAQNYSICKCCYC